MLVLLCKHKRHIFTSQHYTLHLWIITLHFKYRFYLGVTRYKNENSWHINLAESRQCAWPLNHSDSINLPYKLFHRSWEKFSFLFQNKKRDILVDVEDNVWNNYDCQLTQKLPMFFHQIITMCSMLNEHHIVERKSA